MKNSIVAVLGILFGAASIAPAIAQTSPSMPSDPSPPLTRADVNADLVAWRAAGFKPPINFEHYPANAQQAGRSVAEQRAQASGQH
ncbi:hypothetical protein LMG28614_02971 [Paraburkholderia ultramafica]|uniref:DUF4148 domain-containing protein n=1 Tax=Paraburkholderia ultramafica TaxID=1544867 RepID=A0A6S7B6Y0_9BURK|nr:DUF4148 domain-containing protein [Paraburkholderia ultramafica]CAB3789703.1 hypothetical protein LMG28614_02971 [Paraburkholderia ultramafica]